MLFDPCNLLVCLLAVPLAAAIVVGSLGPARGAAIRWLALLATLVTLLVAIAAAVELARMQPVSAAPPAPVPTTAPSGFQPSLVPGAGAGDAQRTTWDVLPIGPGGSAIQFYLGLDGLNVWLVVLTALLMVSAVLFSWSSFQVRERTNEYFAWLLALEVGMLGVFLAFDLVLCYVFFQLTLVPFS